MSLSTHLNYFYTQENYCFLQFQILYNIVNAFKFPDNAQVYITCNVEVFIICSNFKIWKYLIMMHDYTHNGSSRVEHLEMCQIHNTGL